MGRRRRVSALRLLDDVIRWSIAHRLLVVLLAAVAAAAATWAAAHARLDALPDFTPPRVVVQTEAPGLGSGDVEQQVTTPLETALLGTPQTESVRSVSSPGLSVVTLTFEEGIDPYRARQLVAQRLPMARDRLPASAEEPTLAPMTPPIGALLKLCLTTGAGDPAALGRLRTFADWTLRPRLSAIAGVSQVVVHGGDVVRIEVRPDPLRMAALGVGLEDLAAAVAGSQSVLAAGFVEDADTRLDVQQATQLDPARAVDELRSVVLPGERRPPLRLDAVATVSEGVEPPVGAARYDGRPAVYVEIDKVSGADTVATTRRIEAALAELATELPPGGRLEPPVFRQASFVRTSVVSVGRAMATGALLVIAVLIVFLRSPRVAAISLTAIPLSILAAVAILVWRGVSINGMTLGGLAIAVGEVVDDAVVDVENVWRRLRENALASEPRPPLAVVHDAALEVRGSVVYATLIVVLVLVPVMLLGGVAGRIFAPLAEAYALAIGASLLVALTVTPALCALLLPSLATPEARLSRFSEALLVRYRRLLERAMRHRRRVFVVTGVAAAAALVTLPLLGGSFLPELHESSLIGEIQAAPGTSLPETARLAEAIDAQTRPQVAVHTAARIGRAELDQDAAPVHHVEMDFELDPGDRRDAEEIAGDLSARIGRVAGITATVEGFLGERINEILSGETAPVVVALRGADLGRLQAASDRVVGLMRRTPGLSGVREDVGAPIPRLRIVPRRADLGRFGVSAAELARQVTMWRQGEVVTQIRGEGGRRVDVALAGPPALRRREALENLPLRTAAGVSLRLRDVADVEAGSEPAAIRHDGGERLLLIGADVHGVRVTRAARALERRLDGIALPGVRVAVVGQSAARGAAARRLLLIGAAVLVGIFVLLVLALDSWRDAAIALLNFPLGLIGGVLVAALSPDGLSVAGFVGFVTLFGIVARNGILMIAHRQALRQEAPGLDPRQRTLRAAEERLLPILMTAATAGLGLLPLALSIVAAGSELEAPMAMVVLGGLVSSTALTILVLPTLYDALE